MNDRTLFKIALAILFIPILVVSGCNERFRYPCQDPINWDKAICQKPLCDVTRTCPEHVFKNQRDPRLGMPKEGEAAAPQATPAPQAKGCN